MRDVQYSLTHSQTREFQDFRDGPLVRQLMKGDFSKGYPSAIKNNYDLTSLPTDAHRAMAETCDLMYPGKSPKKTRAKESSRFFGVRFRQDLQKWVAEIRVAEWKSVDKKVWLGTFDSEEGAARAVDAARKLLKCKKKRNFNIHSAELEAFSEREKIPPQLNLKDLRDESMFKNVTLFIKKKAQEYAASFCPIMLPESSEPLSTFTHVDLNPGPYDISSQEDMSVATASLKVEKLNDFEDAYYSEAAGPYSDMCSTSASSFSPPSSVSDGCWTPLGTSPEDNANWFQVAASSFEHYQDGGGCSSFNWEELPRKSSSQYSDDGLENEATTSHCLTRPEDQELACSESSRMEAIPLDMWDVLFETYFSESQVNLDQIAMDISTGDEEQPNFDIYTPNRALPPQKLLPDENMDWHFNTLSSLNPCLMNSFELTQAVC